MKQTAKTNSTLAVLWDLDGTLIDSTLHHWKAWVDELATRNISITFEEFSATFGQRNDTTLRRWIHQDISANRIQQISESKEARYRRYIQETGLQLLPGIHQWLKELHSAGVKQALATMTGKENVETIFTVIPIAPFFDTIVTGEQVTNGKPDPEIFLLAAKTLGVSTSQCVVIEDSPAGIEAARRAGMRSIGVNQSQMLPSDWFTDSLAHLSPKVLLEWK